MATYKCSNCGCRENSAYGNYWTEKDRTRLLCSECDPRTGRWHNRFPKHQFDNPTKTKPTSLLDK